MTTTVEMTNIDDVHVTIKEDKWNTTDDILNNGFHEYHEALKKITPELPAMDLIISNFSYFVNVPEKEKHNEPVNLIQTAYNVGKFFTFQSKTHKKMILNNLNLTFPAGSTTIVLGGPGCGTTTLLQALANQIPKGKTSGDIVYGGKAIDKYEWTRVAVICEQLDYHNAPLTVKETFDFSKACQLGTNNFYKDLNLDNNFIKHLELKSELVINSLGLKICENTIVGDQSLRGVSGGERRRVTLGEALLGPQRILLLDKFSTGLDSAVTIDIVRMLSDWAKTFNGIVIAAMLQPDPDVIYSYDQLLLLDKGYNIYFGPPKEGISYFDKLGYKIPKEKDDGSFLSEVATERYRHHSDPNNKYEKVEELKKYYEDSDYNKKVLETVKSKLHFQMELCNTPYSKRLFNSVYALSQFEMFRFTFLRQAKLFIRDKTFLIGRLAQCILMSIIIGLIFGKLPEDNPMPRFGLMFFAQLMTIFGNFAQLGTILAQKKVLAKQRRNKYFSSIHYVLSTVIIQYPFIFLEALFFGTPLYFITKMNDYNHSEAYWTFLATLFCAGLAGFTLIRMLLMLFENEYLSMGMLPMVVFVLANTSGFTTAKNNITPVLRWIYYINPFSYGMTILATNELISPKWGLKGIALLKTMDYPTNKDDKYLWFIAIIIMHFAYMILMIITLALKRYRPSVSYVVDNEELKEMTEMERQESLQRAKSQRSSIITQSVNLSFSNLCYYVKVKDTTTKKMEEKRFLNNLNGFIRANTMTALMGSSGAGKTTLLDVLANRKNTGRVTGDIYLNGQKMDKISLTHYLGYVEQMDNLPSKDTVREVLEFSAKTRLPQDMSDNTKKEMVNDTLKLLGLEQYANLMIGTPGNGLSMAIRKLIMTGIELVANPPIIFLDEPTTGLDSNNALLVVQVLERIAATGKSVICTIHQPSFEIFKLFTDILLLERGGNMIYLGPSGEDGKDIVSYLENHPSHPKLPENTNPASWMLEVTGGGINNNQPLEMHPYYQSSDLKKKNDEILENMLNNIGDKLPKLNRYMTSFPNQVRCCLGRVGRFYWRSSEFIYPRILISLILGLFMGVNYYQSKIKDEAGIQAYMASIFISGFFVGIFSCLLTIILLIQERLGIYRDIDNNLVHPFAYTISYSFFELPITLACSLIITLFVYPMVGYASYADAVFHYIIGVWICLLFTSFLGQIFAFVMPSLQVALLVGVGIIAVMNMLSGFLIPKNDLYYFFKLIYWIDPLQYIMNSLFSSQLFCRESICEPITIAASPVPVELNWLLKNRFCLYYNERWYFLLVVVGYCILTRIPFTIAMFKIRHIKI